MSGYATDEAYATHEVRNQPPERVGFNAFRTDPALGAAVEVFGAGWARERLHEAGGLVGSAQVQTLARDANRFTPELQTHDRFGHRIDWVEFHPAWHELMGMVRRTGLHALGWTETRPGAHVARAALAYLWAQGEAGVGCPAVMTFASLAALRHAPALLAAYEAKILSPDYDPRPLPPAQKQALGVAMAMTEKQGGSDLRQTETVAVAAADGYRLTGHKWFFSVPTSDLFLTLARTQGGISCFLAQGWRDDGSRNFLQLQRLKDKCGNRSNASSEVEFRGLEAQLVGAEGRGIATILEMAHLTRIECAVASAGLIRQAVAEAMHHARHRVAFQRRLIEQPLMRNVLADLVLESEAALWLSLRAAAALDASARDEKERVLSRILAPVAKYWVCKRAPAVAAEALECLGGNGYVEEHVLARLYRDAPLNGLWEGSGNVICLDVLRALQRTPEAVSLLRQELGRVHPLIDAWLLRMPAPTEQNARGLTEALAQACAASLLCRHAPSPIAEAFVQTRLAGGGRHFGALPAELPFEDILCRFSGAAAA
ncbi:acyl-CoA dehydrogenase family protein [Acidocella sp.]|jgi:putative acyl-CoA dehydrogenase|uniref:acyl-CoA dehydrogenase family protein n=1 Tax=Acidocella sp. TaxID=50710 RepID=UPI002F3EA468